MFTKYVNLSIGNLTLLPQASNVITMTFKFNSRVIPDMFAFYNVESRSLTDRVSFRRRELRRRLLDFFEKSNSISIFE